MLENDRLDEPSDLLDLALVEREATPEEAMEPGIQLYVAGLSLSYTISIVEMSGIECHQTTIHKWMKKADIHLSEGYSPIMLPRRDGDTTE